MYLRKFGKPEGTISRIIHFVDMDNYLQIMYDYEIQTLQALQEFFLDREDYETCAIIRDTVLNFNKALGTKHKI